ncbi:AEC family transporter [Clostridium sp.]|nr:AEC family transporter [Clostridium sp.]MCI1714950.1 AEC family transporter [Clostridium sp.]MCI1799212.1 AEC family transporter [Clostridium sp.]MCI1813133.1 AEC family transporter [Clostridium sp.]MCI2200978.1 AEC family transporter [Clostridium sp.]
MSIFLYILGNNIIPIFMLIGLGFIINKKFELSVFTLSKLNFYIFIPGFIFYNLYTTNLSYGMLMILLFCMVNLIINDLIARVISKIRKYDLSQENAFKNSIMFNNTGNIGVSLVTLIFGSAPFVIDGKTPYLSQALAAQIMILVFMNITMNTIGFYNAGRANMDIKDSMHQIFTMPSIYVILIALLLKYIQIDITITPLWPAIEYIKGGLVPMALITLGTQLSKTKFDFRDNNVNTAVFARLIIGPVLALGLIYVFRFKGVIAQTAFISYSVPTAVNTALIAVECHNNQDFASQEVMASTIYSAVTLTSAIYIARILFPV